MIQTNNDANQVVAPSINSDLNFGKVPEKAMSIVNKISKRPLKLFSSPPSSDSSMVSETSSSASSDLSSEITSRVRQLTFAPEPTYHETIARNHFSPEELEATWWQPEEYIEISKRCSKQLHKLARGDELRDKKYCARGLEQHTPLGTLAKSKIRSASIDAVLEEQDRQSRQGIVDDKIISLVYCDVTSSSQMWANTIGQQDQRAAEMVEDDYDELVVIKGSAAPPTKTLFRPRRSVIKVGTRAYARAA